MGVHLGPKATGSILFAGIASSLILAVNEGLPYFFGTARLLPPRLQLILGVVATCFGLLVFFLTVIVAAGWAAERQPGASLLDELDLRRVEPLRPSATHYPFAPNLSDDA